jgi:dUTP pyrophosphatase
MKMRIRRSDKEIPLPEYKTPGAAAMDCAVREDILIAPKSIGYVSLNVSIEPPKGHFILMAARSSLHKRGLMFANGVAIFDQDYCGDADEYKAILYNFSDEPVEIKKGERIAQIILMPYDPIVWDEVETMGKPDRGGIGSTGR